MIHMLHIFNNKIRWNNEIAFLIVLPQFSSLNLAWCFVDIRLTRDLYGPFWPIQYDDTYRFNITKDDTSHIRSRGLLP